MEDDGMDFSPQKNSNEYDKDSFEDDEFITIQSATTKPSGHSSQVPTDNKNQKPQNRPDHHGEKANLNHPVQRTPQALEVTGGGGGASTAAAASANHQNNTESAAAAAGNGSLDTSRSIRSSSSESSSSSSAAPSTANVKRHTGGDSRWEAIQQATAQELAGLHLGHFRLLKRLGYGDIGSVYLVELRGSSAFFAMKVMDKASIISRNKMARAQTEREILGLLDHPFLPTLYTHFETDKFYCLVMEYCSGGNLHSLRQKQPSKHFSEQAARFYTAEILLAMEYLHMLGIVYRDLKPENVLVRDDGHIMLSDFDLSLRCSVCPTLVKSSSVHNSSGVAAPRESGGEGGESGGGPNQAGTQQQQQQQQQQSSFFFPRILPRRSRKASKSDVGALNPAAATVEFNAEPTDARSMSFVGTHEYLAPEIIRGEGHGSAVDWWTLGIFLYELLHGTTPFKGAGNRATLCNVIEQPLRFPSDFGGSSGGGASAVARDLIRGLLVKEPQKRIAFTRGATEIKQHPFFEGVNWALVRSMAPPSVPEPVDFRQYAAAAAATGKEKKAPESGASSAKPGTGDAQSDFDYF